MRFRRLLAFCIAAVLCITMMPAEAFADTEEPEVIFPTQEEIVSYAQAHPTGDTYFDSKGNALKAYSISYEEKPKTTSAYKAGELAIEEQVAALNTIRLIRYIAGLSETVYLFDPYMKRAQAAALVNYVNGKASHNPAIPSGVDKETAASALLGAENSNIDRTSWKNNSLKSSILYAWMYDSDTANLKTLGHRRWILNPSLVMTGFGSVTGSKGTVNTMYIRNEGGTQENVKGICWPAKNTPTSFFDPDSAWSISLGEKIDTSSVVVSLVRTRDYKVWTFSSASADGNFYVDNQNYGEEGCIIFKPKNIGSILDGDKFLVYILYNDETISYDVNFFDLEHFYSPEKSSIISVNISPADKPAIEWKQVKNAEAYDLYRKAKGGTWKLLADDLDEPYFDDATAAAGVKYYYRVVAKRSIGQTVYESEPSASKSITMKLSKASLNSLKSSASGQNRITWKSISKASGYKVYRRISGTSKWTLIKTTKSQAYTDTKAISGVKYDYRVRAYRTCYNNTVYGSYSSPKSVKTK